MLVRNFMNSDLFDTFFEPWFDNRDFTRAERRVFGGSTRLMQTDIKDTGDGYELEMDLPGFAKEEIQATLEKGYLTIIAEKKADKNAQKESDRYICRERYTGKCQRTFYVGEYLEQEDIKASFQHGILRLAFPKEDAKPKVETAKCISIEG